MNPLTRPRSSVAGLVLVALGVLLAWPAHANIVTFDAQPVGTQYGAPAGQVPGDYAFGEDLADVYVEDFFVGGVPYFNLGRIETPFLGFGSGHIMNLNNISIVIDFTAPGDARFEFLDLGGTVNIQVNGAGPVIEAPDFPSLGTFNIAPGVTMSTTWTTVGGGITGVVTLSGPVEKLRIGGQELWVDDLECDNGIGDDPGDCDYAVDYESLAVGTLYGAPVYSPGDWCFNEDGIDVYVVDFDYGGGLLFHQMEVDPAFGPLGAGRVMEVNNIGQLFDLGGLGIVTSQVTFEYIDYGGTENLQINGSPLMVGDLDTWSGLVLGGVHVQVAVVPYGAGQYGEVTLTGNVVELRVGGQEFWMDDLCVTEYTGTADCDLIVDHESLSPGDVWGGPVGTPPGAVIFSEDGIPVTIGILDAGGTPTYNYCEVVPAIFGVGTSNVMLINNVTNTYEIHATDIVSTEVTFVYLDQGGIENLQVNGAALYVGELHLAPANIAPGVICNVSTWMTGGGLAGLVTLTGQVDRLLVGGQEFFIDEICVVGSGGPAFPCDHLSDIESNPVGTGWGSSFANVPGDHMFNEDGLDAFCELYTDAFGGTQFGNARVDPAFPPFGTSQILTINNIGVRYDLTAVGVVDRVRLEYFDGAGTENLQVNGGTLYVGELNLVPANIAAGVTATVFENVGPGYTYGVLLLEGDVQTFVIGGQQFAIDNVCVMLEGTTAVDPVTPKASLTLEPSYPNPFNPSTNLRFSLGLADHVRLTIHDVAGRLVRTLVDEERAAGPHSVQWDGRGEAGRPVSAGIYFVRVASGKESDIQKIALIK